MKDIMLEASRNELISKSKRADIVKSYNSTRYDRRINQNIIKNSSTYNNIDFNELFKAGSLKITLPIKGETDNYETVIFFDGLCDEIKRETARNNNTLEYKCIFRALLSVLNREDIYISCTCKDWQFRHSFYGTMQKYNSGKAESRPPKITNPKDSKGAACKHVLNVLCNLDWAMKVATAINTYINTMENKYPFMYNNIIKDKILEKSTDELDREEPEPDIDEKEYSEEEIDDDN